MKLLFDQHLSPRLVARLIDIFPDSQHVYKLGLDRATDGEVWEFARREHFLILTKDVDFSEMNLLRGFPPKVIWLRCGNCKTVGVERMLRGNCDEIKRLDENEIIGLLTLF